MSLKPKGPIAVFDSGVGGISVLRSLLTEFPQGNFIYLGDTARLPYGTKSEETITQYVKRNLRFLEKYDPSAIVVACNSASSVLDKVQSKAPSIGVIEAGLKSGIAASKHGKIGLWATQTTVSLKKYDHLLSSLAKGKSLISKACPLLVALVEEGLENTQISELAMEMYLKPLLNEQIDTLILGCTHFPFLQDKLQEILSKKNLKISLVHGGQGIAKLLKQQHPELLKTRDAQIKIMLTDYADHFRKFCTNHIPQTMNVSFDKVEI